MPFFSVIAFIWVIISYIDYSHAFSGAENGPQQAVAAAMGCATMIFPYVLIRIAQGQAALTNQKEIIALLKSARPQEESNAPEEKPKKKGGMYLWKKPS